MNNFQSKDRSCEMKVVDPNEVTCFYAGCSCGNCGNCGNWVEFMREPNKTEPARVTPFDLTEVEDLGFEMTFRS